jgi:hypothetical protein
MSAFIDLRDSKTAAKCFKKAIKMNSSRIDAYTRLGLILQHEQDYVGSVATHKIALSLTEHNTENWAMATLMLVSSLSSCVHKFMKPRVHFSLMPDWFCDPYEQIRVAMRCCHVLPNNHLAWHWCASAINFTRRQSNEAAKYWRRASECKCGEEFKVEMLKWAQEVEEGTGDPPMTGMRNGPGGTLTPL